jgi:hypothetical protein
MMRIRRRSTPISANGATNDPDLWVIELDIADGERLIAQWGGDG